MADDVTLKYRFLLEFDKQMISFLKENELFSQQPCEAFIDNDRKVIAFKRGRAVIVLNFHPWKSYDGYILPIKKGAGEYTVSMSSDEERFGGYGRVSMTNVYNVSSRGRLANKMRIYLPSLSAICLIKK